MNDSPYGGAALRRSGLHFVSGRLATAMLSFALLLTLVRVLPTRDYGVYVTLVAWLELTVSIAGIGIPWMSARFVPEFRLHAPGAALRGLALRLLRWLVTALAVAVVIAGLALDRFLISADLAAYRGAGLLFLGTLFAEGLCRLVISSLLDPLMQQQVVRRALLLRQGSLLTVLGVLVVMGDIRLPQVVAAELAASLLGVSFAVVGLLRHLATLESGVGRPGWIEPTPTVMWRTGLHMYGANLITLLYSPQVLLTLVTRVLGAEAAAAFGFLRSLYHQIARYLPATMLLSLVRPKLIASYLTQGDVGELIRNANMAGKLSLFVLMPLVAFVAVTGSPLIDWLSGARLADTGHLFLGFALALIPLSQRQLLESVAVAAGHSRLCLLAAVSGLLTLPVLLLLAHAGLGLWGPVVSIALGQLLFSGTIIAGLWRRISYRADLRGVLKIAASAAVAALASLMLTPGTGINALAMLATKGVLVGVVFLAVAWAIKPFDVAERTRINGLLKRKLFVW